MSYFDMKVQAIMQLNTSNHIVEWRVICMKLYIKDAGKSYLRELIEFTNICKSFEKEELAAFFVSSVWTRAGMQCEGIFTYLNGEKNICSKLSDYPIMLLQFEKIIEKFSNNGFHAEAAAMSIWTHTLKAIINSYETTSEYMDLWNLLISTKIFWEQKLMNLYDDDKNRVDPQLLKDTLVLFREIINELPPNIKYV